MIKIGSLFSGCGGLELGIEAALAPHAETIWQVEREPYARAVLEKHWPNAERYDDVKTVGAHNLKPCDVLCGGFPCTEVSVSNNAWGDPDKMGLAGKNSGLWWEMYRIICELRPGIVIVENVPALVTRGLSTILGALFEAGYDAEWDCVSARSQGAPHKRDRLFIIAYPMRPGLEGQQQPLGAEEKYAPARDTCWWATEPDVGRVANGVPNRAHRLRLLGNAVVPQVAYQVGLRVRELLKEETPRGSSEAPVVNR